jgi:hypothetical protein
MDAQMLNQNYFGSVSWDEGDVVDKTIYEKANSVDLLSIFKLYKLPISFANRKINCPLLNHRKDKTPSFVYYPETNTFFCFGCKCGSYPVDFVSNMDGINRLKAAEKILKNNKTDFLSISQENSDEKNKLLIEFSNYIREYQNKFKFYPTKLKTIEEICEAFDTFHNKYEDQLSAIASLQSLIDKLKNKLDNIS